MNTLKPSEKKNPKNCNKGRKKLYFPPFWEERTKGLTGMETMAVIATEQTKQINLLAGIVRDISEFIILCLDQYTEGENING
jgi:hypothetical protein